MYSAIFPLFAYAMFGSLRQRMTGPDAATCILVAATLDPLANGDAAVYASLLLALTVITGVFYVLAGAGRLGFMANFLSQPILTGYLKAIALLIIVGQLPKLFGYSGTSPDVAAALQPFVELLALYVAAAFFDLHALATRPRGGVCGLAAARPQRYSASGVFRKRDPAKFSRSRRVPSRPARSPVPFS
jgi:MFS superfamily sulfate permease-like transporter